MSKEEKALNMAKNFTELSADMKEKIAWYLLGKQEEREKWEKNRTA